MINLIDDKEDYDIYHCSEISEMEQFFHEIIIALVKRLTKGQEDRSVSLTKEELSNSMDYNSTFSILFDGTLRIRIHKEEVFEGLKDIDIK